MAFEPGVVRRGRRVVSRVEISFRDPASIGEVVGGGAR
jgi:hypothetical protein